MADAFDLKHVERLKARLATLARRIPHEVARALYQEAQVEMTEAKKRTPVDTGALRSTGTVHPPEITFGGDVSVTLSFGGPAAPYAVIVHENLDAFHPVGQAKYLESVIMESRPFLAERIARRIAFERIAT